MASSRRNVEAGRVEVRAYAGKDPVTGKTRNLYRALPIEATEEEVEQARAELDALAGFCKDTGVSFTLSGVLGYLLDSLKSKGYAPSTIMTWRSYARNYVEPYMGGMEVSKLQPYMFESLYRKLSEGGGKGGRPVSGVTIATLHAFLRAAFRSFLRSGIVKTSPLEGVQAPKRSLREAMAMGEDDFSALNGYLKAQASGDRIACALLLCLGTGVRKGELAGFMVGDYDRAGRSIRVARSLSEADEHGKAVLGYKDPKSKDGRRTIALSDDVCAVLDGHLAEQAARLREAGVRQTPKTPLFAADDGSPIRPGRYSTALKAAVRKLGLDPAIHLHTLRHTHASYLIAGGVDIKTVSERLGHSDVRITLSAYAHVLEGRDRAAAEAFASLVAGLPGSETWNERREGGADGV